MRYLSNGPDSDGDTVPDSTDNCDTISNSTRLIQMEMEKEMLAIVHQMDHLHLLLMLIPMEYPIPLIIAMM